ncbi:MAG: hypothetical protein LW720_03150 [Pirellula sp.]|jgi:hypothetical protein|nr:hypothetical protein [Pirellula sp.]
MIDYLRLSFGLIPLGVYLIVMGFLALRRRPTLLTSGQEALLLGFALMGFALIGPIELFFPTGAYAALGQKTWILLIALYGLLVLLFALQRQPGWTVLGLDSHGLRNLLGEILQKGDIEHAWLGNHLQISEWDLQAMIEPSRGFQGVSHLNATGKQRNVLGWYQLERLVVSSPLFSKARGTTGSANWVRSLLLLALGGMSLALATYWIDKDMERLQRLISEILVGR